MRPVIGISGNYHSENDSFYLKEFYVSSIRNVRGTAVILPPTLEEGLIDEYLKVCQGFLLSGGGDLDPVYWDELPGPQAGEIDPLRDGFELILARKALLSRKAILGICRGCQVLNVAVGGGLIQDINSLMTHIQKAPRSYPFHDIFIESDSQLYRILRSDRIRVNSFHHQAVWNAAPGLSVTAMAADGTIEAIESREHPFYLGVQWHPECLQDKFSNRLFSALNSAAQNSDLQR